MLLTVSQGFVRVIRGASGAYQWRKAFRFDSDNTPKPLSCYRRDITNSDSCEYYRRDITNSDACEYLR
jgi:hypothetical protein